MNSQPPVQKSPNWGQSTKMVVAFTLVAVIAALLIMFRNIIGPLLLAFMLAYLLHPLVVRLSRNDRLTWRGAVNLIYIVFVIFVVGLLSLAGLAIAQQLQSLIGLVQTFVTRLPEIATNLSTRTFNFGTLSFSLTQYNLPGLTQQVLGTINPLVQRAGSLLTSVFTSAAITIGWAFFVIVISYFLLSDSGRFRGDIFRIDVPGYNRDLVRLGHQLGEVWNAFLRGQMIIILLVIFFYTIMMFILGVRYAFAIAILAGLARFVPYIGPAVAWTVLALVAFFQGGNYFNISPVIFTILVVGIAIVFDQFFDNIVSPRLLGRRLGVHPAAVLVAALIAIRWIGIIGVVLAAPVLASLQLLGRYVMRKMLDQDPFPPDDQAAKPVVVIHWRLPRLMQQGWEWLKLKISTIKMRRT